jgi:hypothetical protein
VKYDVTLRATGLSGICPCAVVIDRGNMVFQKPDLFPSSGEERETSTVMDPVIEICSS